MELEQTCLRPIQTLHPYYESFVSFGLKQSINVRGADSGKASLKLSFTPRPTDFRSSYLGAPVSYSTQQAYHSSLWL